jgi:hypothetical protein
VTSASIAPGAVGTAQLADGGVTSAALADGAVTPGKLSGTIGAALAGTSGTPSGTNAFVTNSDPRNSNARTPVVHGSALHDGTVLTLASGQTLKGTFTIEFNAAAASGRGSSPISFPLRLSAAPSAVTANIIITGGAATTNCPGSSGNPTALPGQLCLYETTATNISFRCLASVGASYICGNSDTWGTTLFVNSTATGQTTSVGSWAVTAP